VKTKHSVEVDIKTTIDIISTVGRCSALNDTDYLTTSTLR